MSVEQNKALVRQLVEEVFNQGNMSLGDGLFADDFIEHEELPHGMPPGREANKLLTTMLHNAFPDFKATIINLIAKGDKVAIHITWVGTQKGEFMGIPPTGKHAFFDVFDILRNADGKIVEHWGLRDQMGLMQKLGAMPAPA